MSKELQVVLAGFGGQGVLFAGKVIAYAGLLENRELSWLPSYGPEMRGGTANCSVTLSDEPIGSPLITQPNALVAMNQPSFEKFIDSCTSGAAVVYDTDLVTPTSIAPGINACGVAATSLAEEAELKGLGNIVLVGALWALTQFCERATLDAAIDKCVPPRKASLIDKNKQAIEIGIKAATGSN
jgi:2-oxoglutarate ferredoxin oxidoreductase subunit gamma